MKKKKLVAVDAQNHTLTHIQLITFSLRILYLVIVSRWIFNGCFEHMPSPMRRKKWIKKNNIDKKCAAKSNRTFFSHVLSCLALLLASTSVVVPFVIIKCYIFYEIINSSLHFVFYEDWEKKYGDKKWTDKKIDKENEWINDVERKKELCTWNVFLRIHIHSCSSSQISLGIWQQKFYAIKTCRMVGWSRLL